MQCYNKKLPYRRSSRQILLHRMVIAFEDKKGECLDKHVIFNRLSMVIRDCVHFVVGPKIKLIKIPSCAFVNFFFFFFFSIGGLVIFLRRFRLTVVITLELFRRHSVQMRSVILVRVNMSCRLFPRSSFHSIPAVLLGSATHAFVTK